MGDVDGRPAGDGRFAKDSHLMKSIGNRIKNTNIYNPNMSTAVIVFDSV